VNEQSMALSMICTRRNNRDDAKMGWMYFRCHCVCVVYVCWSCVTLLLHCSKTVVKFKKMLACLYKLTGGKQESDNNCWLVPVQFEFVWFAMQL